MSVCYAVQNTICYNPSQNSEEPPEDGDENDHREGKDDHREGKDDICERSLVKVVHWIHVCGYNGRQDTS